MADSELGLVGRAVSEITGEVTAVALELLDPACRQLVEELREKCPDALACAPVKLPPGATAPPVVIDPKRSAALFTIAFTAAARAPAGAAGQAAAVVWADGEHELLVYPGRTRVLFQDGFVLVGVAVFTEQSGAVEISVPFAVGRASAPTGLMIATEPVPRGPALLVERWGDQLIAAAWQALLYVASGAAAAAGTDSTGQPLIPAAVAAGDTGLTVLPQATPAIAGAGA